MGKLTKEDKKDWIKSVRLNMGNRDTFIDTVLEDVMPRDSEPGQQTFCDKWANKLYDVIYPADVVKAMKACPKWMFQETDFIYIDFGMNSHNRAQILKFEVPAKSLALESENSNHYYSSHSDNVGLPKIPSDHPAKAEWEQLNQQARDWSTKRSSLHTQLHQMAYACNTSHQLYEVWPDALKYAQECFPYEEPKEAVRGGDSLVSAAELNIGIKLAQSSVSAIQEN